jgi:hypothetical protein
MRSVRTSLILGVLLALFFVAPSSKADTTYTYTGNAFNDFGGGATCPSECNLTISFVVKTAIGPDADEVGAVPLSFDISNGITTITQANAMSSSFGYFSTDASGNIIGWNINGITSLFKMYSSTGPAGCAGCIVVDASYVNSNVVDIFALINNDPGKWKFATTVPEPSTIFMLGLGFLGLLAFGARKQTA